MTLYLSTALLALTANCDDHTVTTSTGEVYHVGANPKHLASSPYGTYVTNSGDNTLSFIKSGIVKTIQHPRLADPRGIALAGRKVLVVNKNSDELLSFDAITGEFLRAYPTGYSPRQVAVFEEMAYVTNNGDHSITEINLMTGQSRRLGVLPEPYGIAVDQKNCYVTSIGANSLAILARETFSLEEATYIGEHPTAIALHPTKSLLYVTNMDQDRIAVYGGDEVEFIQVGSRPYAFALRGGYLFVTNNGDDTLSIIDLGTHQVVETLPTGRDPHGIVLMEQE